MSDDGRVSISGRIKDMIIRGGENVFPKEIEDFLYTHQDVQEVQVGRTMGPDWKMEDCVVNVETRLD